MGLLKFGCFPFICIYKSQIPFCVSLKTTKAIPEAGIQLKQVVSSFNKIKLGTLACLLCKWEGVEIRKLTIWKTNYKPEISIFSVSQGIIHL